MRLNSSAFKLVVFLLAGIAAFPLSAFGQCPEHDYYWVAGSGDWSTRENWRHAVWDPDLEQCVLVPGVPRSDDTAWIRNGGTAAVTSIVPAVSWVEVESSYVTITNGSLTAGEEVIGNYATANVSQSGGTHTVNTLLSLGVSPGSNGSYYLEDGDLFAQYMEIATYGSGSFTQVGGRNEISQWFGLGDFAGSTGTYTLSGGELSANSETVGFQDRSRGTFTHEGGINSIADFLSVGVYAGSEGTYELSGSGELSANWETVGVAGEGTFIQNGGTNAIANNLMLGERSDSDGTYNLLGGTLDVGGDIDVGGKGTGYFVVNGGTINGTTDGAELFVNGSLGTLTGPGTFNIEVTYQSDEMYGTNGNECVCITFDRNCLTEGGAYSVTQLTPTDFAGGTLPNLLASSVFDVSFDGTSCGDFIIAIPYDEAEVVVLGVSETSLAIVQETGPKKYRVLENTFVDTEDDVVYAETDAFGKYGITSSEPPEDSEPPRTKHQLSGSDVQNVEVSLSASDDGSGVDYTVYSINGSSWQEYNTPFLIDLSNTHTVRYYSVDNEGNKEKKYKTIEIESLGKQNADTGCICYVYQWGYGWVENYDIEIEIAYFLINSPQERNVIFLAGAFPEVELPSIKTNIELYVIDKIEIRDRGYPWRPWPGPLKRFEYAPSDPGHDWDPGQGCYEFIAAIYYVDWNKNNRKYTIWLHFGTTSIMFFEPRKKACNEDAWFKVVVTP